MSDQDSAFYDALVGLACVSARFDELLVVGDLDALARSTPEHSDALVGLCSLNALVLRLVRALGGDPESTPPNTPATWQREHLR